MSKPLPIKQRDLSVSIEFARELIGCGALLVFISAVWTEWDAYRYVACVCLIPAAIRYFRDEFSRPDGIRGGYMGLLCLGWGIYVALRFVFDFMVYPEQGIGTSEGIYLFPFLYPLSGFALLAYIRRPWTAVSAFILISFVAVLFSADFAAIAEGRRASFILHDNPIHAAIANGIMVLCILSFASYLLRAQNLQLELRIGYAFIAAAVFLVGLINIYALRSKGVWLSLAVALPVQLFLIVAIHGAARRVLILMAGIVFIAAVIGTFLAWDGIRVVAGDTARAAAQIISDMSGGAGLLESMDRAIQDSSTPANFRERLMLWASAILIWMKEPIFGQGVTWLYAWQTRAYPDTAFNLLHNGYLEIAIRYGIVGLAFYAALFIWAIRQVWRAKREGLIDPAALHAYLGVLLFFCMTILTNSNVRLALGESYMWFSAAFGFYCFYRLQRSGFVKARTWL